MRWKRFPASAFRATVRSAHLRPSAFAQLDAAGAGVARRHADRGSQIDGVDLEQIGTNGVSRIEVVEGGVRRCTDRGPSAASSTSSPTPRPRSERAFRPARRHAALRLQHAVRLVLAFVREQRLRAPDGTVRGNSQASFNTIGLHYAHRIGAIEASLTGSLVSNALGAPERSRFSHQPANNPISSATAVSRSPTRRRAPCRRCKSASRRSTSALLAMRRRSKLL